MTWKEFKDWMTAKGVRDEEEIDWIDFSGDPDEMYRRNDKVCVY